MSAKERALLSRHPVVWDELTDADRERLSLDESEPPLEADELEAGDSGGSPPSSPRERAIEHQITMVSDGRCPHCGARLPAPWPGRALVRCWGCGVDIASGHTEA